MVDAPLKKVLADEKAKEQVRQAVEEKKIRRSERPDGTVLVRLKSPVFDKNEKLWPIGIHYMPADLVTASAIRLDPEEAEELPDQPVVTSPPPPQEPPPNPPQAPAKDTKDK